MSESCQNQSLSQCASDRLEWTLSVLAQVWFTRLASNRLTLLWGHEGAQPQVEHMETSVLLAGDAPVSLPIALSIPEAHLLFFSSSR